MKAKRNLRIHLKTSFICLTVSFAVTFNASAESVATPSQSVSTQILSVAGELEGYLSLPVAGEEIDATLVQDKLGRDYGTVLLLHDEDGGIDSRNLIHTLRLGLPQAGWSSMTVALHYSRMAAITLSERVDEAEETKPAETETASGLVQPDIKETAAPVVLADNLSRVSAALAHLQAQTTGPVVVLGIGSSVSVANQIVTEGNQVTGLIWLRADSKTIKPLPVAVRLLDITASRPAAIRLQAQQRQAEMKRHNATHYVQRTVAGADPFFYGYEESVLGIVRGWLYKQYVEYTN